MKFLSPSALFILIWASLPNIVAAQGDLECPATFTVGNVDINATPDFIHQPVAFPGAFGGTVGCLLQQRGNSIERFFAEILAPGDATNDEVYYLNNSIKYYLKFQGENETRSEVVTCEWRNDGGMACVVDLAIGDGLRLTRYFDPDLQLVGVQLVASPDMGIVNTVFWDTMKEQILNDPNTNFTLTVSLPEEGFSVVLPLLSGSQPGTPLYGVQGQAAFEFMVPIFNRSQPINIEAVVERLQGTQIVTSSIDQTIFASAVGYLLGRLGAVEQLMAAGYEGSKALEF